MEFRSMKETYSRVIQQVGIVLRDVLLAGAGFLLASELRAVLSGAPDDRGDSVRSQCADRRT
jgi:hypothetical protein